MQCTVNIARTVHATYGEVEAIVQGMAMRHPFTVYQEKGQPPLCAWPWRVPDEAKQVIDRHFGACTHQVGSEVK